MSKFSHCVWCLPEIVFSLIQFTFQIQFNITVHISKVSDQSLSLTVFHRVSSSPAKHSNSISHWGSIVESVQEMNEGTINYHNYMVFFLKIDSCFCQRKNIICLFPIPSTFIWIDRQYFMICKKLPAVLGLCRLFIGWRKLRNFKCKAIIEFNYRNDRIGHEDPRLERESSESSILNLNWSIFVWDRKINCILIMLLTGAEIDIWMLLKRTIQIWQ